WLLVAGRGEEGVAAGGADDGVDGPVAPLFWPVVVGGYTAGREHAATPTENNGARRRSPERRQGAAAQSVGRVGIFEQVLAQILRHRATVDDHAVGVGPGGLGNQEFITKGLDEAGGAVKRQLKHLRLLLQQLGPVRGEAGGVVVVRKVVHGKHP